jgi:hypothetical protein
MTAYKVKYEYKPKPVDIDNPEDPYRWVTNWGGETIVWAENITEAFKKTLEAIHVHSHERHVRETQIAIEQKLPYPIKKEIIISKINLEVAYLNVIV